MSATATTSTTANTTVTISSGGSGSSGSAGADPNVVDSKKSYEEFLQTMRALIEREPNARNLIIREAQKTQDSHHQHQHQHQHRNPSASLSTSAGALPSPSPPPSAGVTSISATPSGVSGGGGSGRPALLTVGSGGTGTSAALDSPQPSFLVPPSTPAPATQPSAADQLAKLEDRVAYYENEIKKREKSENAEHMKQVTTLLELLKGADEDVRRFKVSASLAEVPAPWAAQLAEVARAAQAAAVSSAKAEVSSAKAEAALVQMQATLSEPQNRHASSMSEADYDELLTSYRVFAHFAGWATSLGPVPLSCADEHEPGRFKWPDNNEGTAANKDAYITFVTNWFPPAVKDAITVQSGDRGAGRGVLPALVFHNHQQRRKRAKGNPDILVSITKQTALIAARTVVVIELLAPGKSIAQKLKQAATYLLSANHASHERPFVVVTDLQDQWQILYLEEVNAASSTAAGASAATATASAATATASAATASAATASASTGSATSSLASAATPLATTPAAPSAASAAAAPPIGASTNVTPPPAAALQAQVAQTSDAAAASTAAAAANSSTAPPQRLAALQANRRITQQLSRPSPTVTSPSSSAAAPAHSDLKSTMTAGSQGKSTTAVGGKRKFKSEAAPWAFRLAMYKCKGRDALTLIRYSVLKALDADAKCTEAQKLRKKCRGDAKAMDAFGPMNRADAQKYLWQLNFNFRASDDELNFRASDDELNFRASDELIPKAAGPPGPSSPPQSSVGPVAPPPSAPQHPPCSFVVRDGQLYLCKGWRRPTHADYDREDPDDALDADARQRSAVAEWLCDSLNASLAEM